MNIEKLIKMANQIGEFFEAYPDNEAAKKGIAAHLKRYWNSVMIKSIVAHVNDHDSNDKGSNNSSSSNKSAALAPRVLAAVKEHLV